jgi:hypothetical protein
VASQSVGVGRGTEGVRPGGRWVGGMASPLAIQWGSRVGSGVGGRPVHPTPV